MKDNMTVREAMKVLGITDIHMTQQEAKKIYHALIKKWHPDRCTLEERDLYTDKTAEINAAYDVIERAYQNGTMGPDAKDYYSSSRTTSNGSSSYNNGNNSQSNRNTGYQRSSSNTSDGPRKGYRYTYTSSGWTWTKDPAYEEKTSYSSWNDNTGYDDTNNNEDDHSSDDNDSTGTTTEEQDNVLVRLFKRIFDRSLNSLIILFLFFTIIGLTGFNEAMATGDETNTLVLSYIVVTFIGFYLGFLAFKKFLELGSVFIGGIASLMCAWFLTYIFLKPITYLADGSIFLAYLYFYGIWAAIEAKLNVPKALAAIKSDKFFGTIKGAVLLIEYALLFGSSIIYLIYSIFK